MFARPPPAGGRGANVNAEAIPDLGLLNTFMRRQQ
jgi:hypothetical protein